MKKLFSSADHKKVICFHDSNGYCDPLIFESQHESDLVGKNLKEIFESDKSLDIVQVFHRMDWFLVTEKSDIAGIYFFVDCKNDKDFPHETWKQQAEELKNNTSEGFIDTTLKTNGHLPL